MIKLDWVDSLYVLSDQHRELCQELEQYDIFFSMLRHDYIDNTMALSTMYDLFLYYYCKEKGIYNSELTMIYLLRHFVIETVRTKPKFERIKMHTVNSYTKSLLASAFTVNLFIDINRAIIKELPKEDVAFMLKYSDSSKVLFKEKFEQYDSYPRKLVKIETTILQRMRQYYTENEKQIEQKLLEIIQFMDQYALDERDIFEHGILK